MKLWLLRHAPVLAEPGLCYGRSELAAEAAATEAAAQAISLELPAGVALRCSPRQRCLQMARALLALRPDLALATDERLAEMGFGTWEGRPWDDIGQDALDAWTRDFADARPGGGESVREFMARVDHAFADWRARPAETLWITHAGVARAVLLLQQGIACPAVAADWPATPGLSPGAWLSVAAGPPAA